MKIVFLLSLLTLLTVQAGARQGQASGEWHCAVTSRYRNAWMSYWGIASSRDVAHHHALANCRREATLPLSCTLYTCVTQDNSWTYPSDEDNARGELGR